MEEKRIISIEDRIPKLKEARKKKANRRLLFYLTVFFLLISIIVYLQSPLSHVKEIVVVGNKFIPDEEIIERSKLTDNTNIWSVNEKAIANRLEGHPLIESISLERVLPRTIELEINEHVVVGYVKEKNGFHPVLESGMIVTTEDKAYQDGNFLLLNNFTDGQHLERMAHELSKLSTQIYQLISEVTWEPTEKNKYKIILYMNDGYIVHTTIRNFSSKISAYPSIVSQLDTDDKGIIHMDVGTYFEQKE